MIENFPWERGYSTMWEIFLATLILIRLLADWTGLTK